MKKYIGLILMILFVLPLTACGKGDKHVIEIMVPAGSTEAFVYSEEEIMATGNQITIWSGAGLSDTEVILKPVDDNVETGYVAEYLTHGMPVKLDAVKGEWFKVGVAVQNDSERGPIAVSVEIEGAEVRIAETEETEEVTDSKAKEIKAENIVKEWTTSEISELFKRKTDEDCTLITCASVYDFAYDRVGAILYTDSKEGYVHVAFMDKEGNMQHCGVEATIIDSPEFTYLGNGEVTFKVCSKDGTNYTQKISFSVDEDKVNFVSEAIEDISEERISELKEKYNLMEPEEERSFVL